MKKWSISLSGLTILNMTSMAESAKSIMIIRTVTTNTIILIINIMERSLPTLLNMKTTTPDIARYTKQNTID